MDIYFILFYITKSYYNHITFCKNLVKITIEIIISFSNCLTFFLFSMNYNKLTLKECENMVDTSFM